MKLKRKKRKSGDVHFLHFRKKELLLLYIAMLENSICVTVTKVRLNVKKAAIPDMFYPPYAYSFSKKRMRKQNSFHVVGNADTYKLRTG